MPNIDDKKFLSILIFLHSAIALPLAYAVNIWADEASTLHTTNDGFARAFQNLFSDEKQAPLYFLLLSLWRGIDDSIFFARLFSVVCSLLAIFAFARLARKLWQPDAARLLTTLFALHPYLFWAGLEIRLYSFVIFITCLLFDAFHDGFLAEETDFGEGAKAPQRARYFYVTVSIAALYTNYYLGFLLVGGLAALLVLGRRRQARQYFLAMLAVGVAILPLFYIISLQFAERGATYQPEKPLLDGVRMLWNHFLTFVLPTEIYTDETGSVVSFVRLWTVRLSLLAAFVLLVKNRFRAVNRTIIAYGTIAAVGGAFFLFVYFQLGAGYIEIRHAAVYFAAIMIFAGALLVGLLPRRAWFFAALLYAVFFTYAIAVMHPNLTKRGDWARVARYIAEREKPDQPIVFFPVYDALALPYYYRGANRILPGERYFDFHTEAELGNQNSFRRQIEFIISRIPPEAEEIWLLTDENCQIKQACEPLDNFVAQNYTIIEEKGFYKEKVRLLRRKQK